MKIGDMIKCTQVGHSVIYGIIIKIRDAPKPVRSPLYEATWAEIQWADGHRTWEDMECSFEAGVFEVISECK